MDLLLLLRRGFPSWCDERGQSQSPKPSFLGAQQEKRIPLLEVTTRFFFFPQNRGAAHGEYHGRGH